MVVQLVTLLMKFFAFTFSKFYSASVTEFLKNERKCDKKKERIKAVHTTWQSKLFMFKGINTSKNHHLPKKIHPRTSSLEKNL